MSTDNMNLIHNIDLEYLMNPDQQKKIAEKYEGNQISDDERKFYRKRLLQLTRDLIAGEIQNTNLEAAFNNYLKESIKYLKFTDKKDIIQEEYVEINKKMEQRRERKIKKAVSEGVQNKETQPEINGTNADQLLINKSQIKAPAMNNFIKIKKNPSQKNQIMPKQRDIDLSDPKLKKKGIKKKKDKK